MPRHTPIRRFEQYRDPSRSRSSSPNSRTQEKTGRNWLTDSSGLENRTNNKKIDWKCNCFKEPRDVLIPRSGNVSKPRVAIEASYPGQVEYLISTRYGLRPFMQLCVSDLDDTTALRLNDLQC